MPIDESYQLPRSNSNTGGFDPLPEDTYQVEITNIVLKRDQPLYNDPTKTEDKFGFEYTVIEPGPYEGRKVFQDVRTSFTPGFQGGNPSWLYKIFSAVNNGVMLNDDEASTVTIKTINEMVGKELRLIVKQKQNQKKDKIYNRVTDVLAVKFLISKGLHTKLNLNPSLMLPKDEDDELPPPPSDDDVDVSDIPF